MDDDLLCLFSARVEERGRSDLIEVPEREVDLDTLDPGGTYRVALLSKARPSASEGTSARESSQPNIPVDEGDLVDVEIENLGDQGDGIARVGPGYVVIVPDTKPGDRVSVEIIEVRENVAFAEVVEGSDPRD